MSAMTVFQAREIECQKCRVFPVTVMRPRDFKECAPVYSEECETQYEQHCKVNKRRVVIYQTQCHTSNAYTQTCQQVRPSSHVTSHL